MKESVVTVLIFFHRVAGLIRTFHLERDGHWLYLPYDEKKPNHYTGQNIISRYKFLSSSGMVRLM